MEFNQFKRILQNRLSAEVESKLDGTIEFSEVMKNGGIKNGIIYRPAGSRIGITTYVESCYEAYQKGCSMDRIVGEYVPAMMDHSPDVKINYDELMKTLVPENIFPVLLPRKGNEELLEKIPHVPFQNLEIIFKFHIPEFFGGGVTDVNNYFSAEFGLDAEEILSIAMNNIKEQMVVMPLREMVFGTRKPGIDWDSLKDSGEEMLVVSNQSGFYGAATILDQDTMIKITDLFKEDVYILPSSVHECIVVSKSMGPIEDLQKLVKSANQEVVKPEEWLSDDVYVFDSHTREITLAADVREKAEQQMHMVSSPSVR